MLSHDVQTAHELNIRNKTANLYRVNSLPNPNDASDPEYWNKWDALTKARREADRNLLTAARYARYAGAVSDSNVLLIIARTEDGLGAQADRRAGIDRHRVGPLSVNLQERYLR